MILKKNGVGEEYQFVGNFMHPWLKLLPADVGGVVVLAVGVTREHLGTNSKIKKGLRKKDAKHVIKKAYITQKLGKKYY